MNAASSWGNSTGFGSSNPQAGSNSSQANSSLFGSGQPSQAPQAPGLFGNSNLPSGNSGGLFGNNATTNATSSGASGGLFGNSSGAKPATSMLGGSNSQPSNPSNTNLTSNGGLFGNSSSGGLINNSAKRASSEGPTAASKGLFGSSSASLAPGSGGLFGSSTNQAPNPNSLFSSSTSGQTPATAPGMNSTGIPGTQSTGLFGSTNAAPTSGLFGNSNSSGKLFGNSNNTTGSLFANTSSNNASQNQTSFQNNLVSSNQYGSSSILSAINTTEGMMPSSITSSMFGSVQNANLKKSKSVAPSSKTFKGSLLGKLAQTFNIFRPGKSQYATKASLKGIFSQSNYVKDVPAPVTSKFRVQKQARKGLDISARSLGAVNNLVVKSKPTKFHLIDADKVFRPKQCKVISSRDDDSSETESEGESPIPQPVTDGTSKSAKTMDGQGIDSNEVPAEDKTDDPEFNNGYFCYPSIKELALLAGSQLEEVPDFIVGRVGHGQVAYSAPVDLSKIFKRFSFDTNAIAKELFGRLFVFNAPYVIVYDERVYDPVPEGSELNQSATVSLKTPPPKNRAIEDFIRSLKNKDGQEFITYDPITYYWTSHVKHFSVWGLLDDDEVEGDELEELKRLREIKKKQDEREREISSNQSNLYENETYHNELKRQRIQRQTSGIPGGWDFDTRAKSEHGLLNVKQGLVQNEINSEVNQFKTDKSAIYIATNASDITYDSEAGSLNGSQEDLASEGGVFSGEAKNFDYIKQLVHVAPMNFEMEQIVDEKAYEPDLDNEDAFKVFERNSSFPTSKNWFIQLELANEVSSALAPELTRPRKTQPALHSVNDILFTDLPSQHDEFYQASTPMNEIPEPRLLLDNASTIEKEVLSKFLKNVLMKSSISTRDNNFPLLNFNASIKFEAMAALLSETDDAQYLRLAAILFDTPDLRVFAKYRDLDYSNMHLVERLQCIEERQALAGWFKIYNKNLYQELFVSEDPLDRIFYYACQGELKDATSLAIESCNLHLAPLLTLMDSNDPTVRSIAKGQLRSWKEAGYSEFIPESVSKTYRLLAGDFAFFVGQLPDYFSLALEVFYGNPAESTSSMIARFCKDVELNDELGCIFKINTAFKAGSFAKCCQILVDSNLSPKLKWILYHMMSNSGLGAKDCAAQDSIANLFGKELERYGLWKEALYVYASMESDDGAEEAIRAALIGSVDHFEEDKEEQEFLEKIVKVPRELIYEAISLKKRRREDFWGCGEALVIAGMWDEAHELICERLAPLAIIEEGTTMKSVVRALIDSFPQGGSLIGSWSQGAGLYSKYFEVVEQADQRRDIEVSNVTYLLDNLALVQKTDIYLVNVATQIMSKKIGDLALDNQDKIAQAREKVFQLPLGENERAYFACRLDK